MYNLTILKCQVSVGSTADPKTFRVKKISSRIAALNIFKEHPTLPHVITHVYVIVQSVASLYKYPIHMFVEEISPSVIVSYGSTASLNLKLLLPENVKSYVYLFRDSKLPINTYLETLFAKLGISITELK